MSLVSAVVDDDNVSTTTSTRNSVYQTTGKPLSKEALYRAKLKYGVYQSPARQTTTGVSDVKVASDVAANLANSNKVTIEAYKRLFVDSNASKAATSVTSSNRSRASSVTSKVSTTDTRSLKAASKALSTPAKPTVEQSVAPRTPALNITKVLEGAERNAGKRIDSRTNPERVNFTYGLKTGGSAKAAETSFTLTSEIIDNIYSKSEYVAEAETEADPRQYASKAAYAVRNFDPKQTTDKALAEKEKQKQAYFKQLTSQEVLSLARANAQESLNKIDRKNAEARLFDNEEYNKLAVAIAQKNSSKSSQTTGKINLGGGLWLTPQDVDNIAKGLITPVLDEVDTRAVQQRAVDEDIKQRNVDYKEQYAEWKVLQVGKLANDKTMLRETAMRHERETLSAHNNAEKKYKGLCDTKTAAVQAKEQDLAETEKSYEELQREMEGLLEEEATRVETELSELNKAHKLDIIAARTEQDELLKPYIDDVTAAETEHERLLKERDDITKEIEDLRQSIEDHKSNIERLTEEIEEADGKHAEEERNLDDLLTSKDGLKEDIDTNIVVVATRAKEQAALSSEEARLKQLEVNAMLNERQGELNKAELDLKREKLSLLESMRNVAELKGDDKLDEEKLKALIGVTSDEFVAQQKREESEAKAREQSEAKVKASEKEAKVKTDSAITDSKQASDSASAKSLTGTSGIIKASSDLTTSADVSKAKKADLKTTAASPTGEKKYSMVDAVIPEDYVPQPITPKKKNVDKKFDATSPKANGSAKKPSSLKEKLFGGKKEKEHVDTVVPAVVSPKKKTELKKETQDETQGKNQDEVQKKAIQTDVEAKSDSKNKLEPTFSGFSQGSIPEDKQEKVVGDSTVDPSEEDDVPDLSEIEEGSSVKDNHNRASLFKEVF